MYQIRTVGDFADYGIAPLTGERCEFSLRTLFDVSAKGRETLISFLDLPYDTQFCRPWNSLAGNEPAVGSIMLPRSMMEDLAEYILHNIPTVVKVVVRDGTVIGLSADEVEKYAAFL